MPRRGGKGKTRMREPMESRKEQKRQSLLEFFLAYGGKTDERAARPSLGAADAGPGGKPAGGPVYRGRAVQDDIRHHRDAGFRMLFLHH